MVEEFTDVTELVPVPLLLTVDQPALNKTLDPLRKPKNVTQAIVVSDTIFCERRFIYIFPQKVFEFHNFSLSRRIANITICYTIQAQN